MQTVRLAVKTLLLHKLRSGLAILGILIGVSAVIFLVACGDAVSERAQNLIKSLGATNIIVRSDKPPAGSSTAQQNQRIAAYGLLRSDFNRIAKNIPSIVRATPIRELYREARYGERTTECRLVGCTPAYLDMNALSLSAGRFIEDRDLQVSDNVCVIADGAASKLFPYENPIGRAVQIDDDFYVIVGRTADRQPTGNIGGTFSSQDYNLDIYIPIDTLWWRIGDQVRTTRTAGSFEMELVELSQVTVTVSDITQVEDAEDNIRALLEKYHELEDYKLTVPKELLRQAEVWRIVLLILSVVIAGISLFVGGIGIMNIMLANVTERTREIGIRRALGAKRRDIILQFLGETIVLTAIGGILGIAMGMAAPWVFEGLRSAMNDWLPGVMADLPVEARETINDLELRVAWLAVIIAFSTSMVVGVVSGMYPAWRASRMDPIEALRHE